MTSNVSYLIRSDSSTVLNVFCFSLSQDDSLRALMSGQRQKAQPPCGPVCSEWSVSLSSSDPSSHWYLFGDAIANAFWRQIQGANLGGQGRRGTAFPTSAPLVHDFDFTGGELWRHGGGGWCRMIPDSGRLKKVAPKPPPSRKL